MLVIFDLDQTLIDSKIALPLRSQRNWRAVYRVIPQMNLYPMIMETIRYLQANNHELAIVTSAPGTYSNKIIKYFNLRITNVVCYHDTVRKKPDPAPINRAIANSSFNAENTISLGDRDADVIASKRANTVSCACFWDCDDRDKLIRSNPDYSFNSSLDIKG